MTRFEEVYCRLSSKDYKYTDTDKVYEDLAILNEEYNDLHKENEYCRVLIADLEDTLMRIRTVLNSRC